MTGRSGVDAIGRVVTAMVTPFTPDGTLDLAGAATLVGHLIASGSDGIVVGGTTGESPTLRDDELWELVAAVRAAAGPDVRVVVGTGTNDTARTVERTLRAAEAGADAALLVTPYYNRPTQAGLRAHVRAVAGATDLALLLYDVPGRTGRELGVDTLADLASLPTIVGVKDATGGATKAPEVLAATSGAPGGFAVWSGADEVNLPLLAAGAVGIVSVAAHLVGPELAEMVRVAGTDPERARELERRCEPLVRALFLESNPGPLKALLAARGLPGGPLRLPLVLPPDDVTAAGLAALADVERAREVAP